MTANEILKWLEAEQGSASKRAIRTVWSLFPTVGQECVYVWPDDRKAIRAGLQHSRNYSLECALREIGVKFLADKNKESKKEDWHDFFFDSYL